jgi:PAS domain-containing protein
LRSDRRFALIAGMAQQEIEVILFRQLASCLAMPIFIVDPAGTLIYYNEPAEALLGQRFEETGAMAADEWATSFRPSDRDGNPIAGAQLPLVRALADRCPINANIWIHGMDGVQRHLSVTAFPLDGQAGRLLGAAALFWETEP